MLAAGHTIGQSENRYELACGKTLGGGTHDGVAKGYEMFQKTLDGCVRAVFVPK